jgi:hypothetical protein
MVEADWGLLLKWNNDPEVLYYAEGDAAARHSSEQGTRSSLLSSNSREARPGTAMTWP